MSRLTRLWMRHSELTSSVSATGRTGQPVSLQRREIPSLLISRTCGMLFLR